MKVAVSITKVFEVDEGESCIIDMNSLAHQFERDDYEDNGIDWYNIEKCQDIWSYAIVR